MDLCGGIYKVTVTDALDNVVEKEVSLNFPGNLIGTFDIDHIYCYSEYGEATIEIIGGVSPYSYLWSTGDTTAAIDSLISGTYYVSVTDYNNCLFVDSVTVDSLNTFVTYVTITDVLCFGDSTGSAELNVLGGTEPYTYLWSTGDTTVNISNLKMGYYSYTVTDINGCIDIDSVLIREPNMALGTYVWSRHLDCSQDSIGVIKMEPIGGTPPYTFLWDTGATIDSIINLKEGVIMLLLQMIMDVF